MWILNKDERVVLNSNQVRSIGILGNDLLADGTICVGIFSTEDEAKKELKQIYDALIAGNESYSVG